MRYFYLVLILLLAAVLVFHNIESRSLWEDEGWTLLLVAGDGVADVVQTLAYDQHSPLYFVAMHQWLPLAGDSEFSLRALSAFFAILSVAAMYQLGRYAFGWRVGLLAAALLAVWDFSIDLGQDARQYSMLLFFSTLSCAYFFRYVRCPSRAAGLGWLLASIAALYTQYMAGLVVGLQLVYILAWQPRPRFDLLLRWVAIGAAFSPWIPVFIRQNQVRWDDPIYYQSGLPNTPATFIMLRDALLTKQFALVLGLLFLGLVITKQRRLDKQAVFFVLWAAGYTGLIIYLNEKQEILRLRIFILVLPPIMLLVGRGLVNLTVFPRVFLLAVLLGANLFTIDTRQLKAPWREVVQNVTTLHQNDEPVLMDIWVGDFSARYYVEKQMGAPWLSLRELRRSAGDFFLPQLAAYVENLDAFWLLRWNDTPEDYDGLLQNLGFQRTASPFVAHVGNQLYTHRYDRLQAENLATFGDTLNLMKAEVSQAEGIIRANLWWTANAPPPLDYSISVFILDETGATVAQNDTPPPIPTSQWQPGTLYFDPHQLVHALPAGRYSVNLRVYWYAEPDQPLPTGSADFAIMEVIDIP